MDSLYDLMAGKNFDEPSEIADIKKFVRDLYQVEVTVALRERDIIVTVPSAALASRLRYDLPKLKQKLASAKQIVLRIG